MHIYVCTYIHVYITYNIPAETSKNWKSLITHSAPDIDYCLFFKLSHTKLSGRSESYPS